MRSSDVVKILHINNDIIVLLTEWSNDSVRCDTRTA